MGERVLTPAVVVETIEKIVVNKLLVSKRGGWILFHDLPWRVLLCLVTEVFVGEGNALSITYVRKS